MSNYTKELVLSNIIGINPTGTLQFDGTYTLLGNNNIIQTSKTASKENLDKTQKNKIVCNNIENFENNSSGLFLQGFSEINISIYKILVLFIILILFIILFLAVIKKI
jgi:hypothetical protein